MNTEQAYRAERPLSWSRGVSDNGESEAVVGSRTRTGERRPRRNWSIFGYEWAPATLFLFLDVSSWVLIYGTISFLRGDVFYSTPLQFFLIDVLQDRKSTRLNSSHRT